MKFSEDKFFYLLWIFVPILGLYFSFINYLTDYNYNEVITLRHADDKKISLNITMIQVGGSTRSRGFPAPIWEIEYDGEVFECGRCDASPFCKDKVYQIKKQFYLREIRMQVANGNKDNFLRLKSRRNRFCRMENFKLLNHEDIDFVKQNSGVDLSKYR